MAGDEAGKQMIFVNDLEKSEIKKSMKDGKLDDKNADSSKPKTVKEFMEEYNGIIESIALFNLNKDRPIVPLKIII